MDRKLAEEINNYLPAASEALWNAEQAGQKLKSYKERKAFNKLIGSVLAQLHLRLMESLYAEHPQLEPAHDRSFLSTALRWEDVSLPKSVSIENLDAAILEVLTPRSHKMAKVIPNAAERCKALRVQNRFEIIGARIQALAEAGRIEGAGDLQRWMNSEVRLPQRGRPSTEGW